MKPFARVALATALSLMPACDGPAEAPTDAEPATDTRPLDPSCAVTLPSACVDPAPTYGEVAPIFEARCVICHGTVDGLWPLITYSHVVDWYAEIRSSLLDCSMPPADAGVAMTIDERETILKWIRCGTPR